MAKSRDAFRTISEVAEWLETPAHVLRFWETKFSQIKPVKRAGGRRYYRPEDMALIGGLKVLLHEQGMTIKGAQKMLREQGVRHVASLGPQPPGAGEGPFGAEVTPLPGLAAATPGAPEAPQLAFATGEAEPSAETAQAPFIARAAAPRPGEAEAPPAGLAARADAPASLAPAGRPAGADAPWQGGAAEAEAPALASSPEAPGSVEVPAMPRGPSIGEGAAERPHPRAPLRSYAAVFRMDVQAARDRGNRIAPLFQRLSALRDALARDPA